MDVHVASRDTRNAEIMEMAELRARYASAVRTLQDIGRDKLTGNGKRARDTLIQLGEPIEPEGM
jgi:hypothetical protein